jgi:hypothetical protein
LVWQKKFGPARNILGPVKADFNECKSSFGLGQKVWDFGPAQNILGSVEGQGNTS